MFGKTDIFNLKLVFYDNNKIIDIHKIGNGNVEVPNNVKKVSLVEHFNNEERVINNYYVGNQFNFIDLLNNSSYIIDISNLPDSELLKINENTNVLYEIKDHKIIVEKILNKDERVFDIRLKLVHHLCKLNTRLELFYKECNEVKTLIYR